MKRVGRGAKSAATHELRDAVVAYAECPCAEHEQAFLTALIAQAELSLLVQPTGDAGAEPAARTAEHDGAAWLLCFPDAASAEAKGISPDDVVGVVPPAVACALVVQAGLGGLHMEAGTTDDAWVGVPLEKMRHPRRRMSARRRGHCTGRGFGVDYRSRQHRRHLRGTEHGHD